MADPISKTDVEHVARLARLALTDDEVEHLTLELAGILSHARDIEALDLTDVMPTAHPLPLSNVLRADEVRAEPPPGSEATSSLPASVRYNAATRPSETSAVWD